MQHIVETYHLPNRDFSNPEDKQRDGVDVLRRFPLRFPARLCPKGKFTEGTTGAYKMW